MSIILDEAQAYISIHALRKESDPSDRQRHQTANNFNPRSP